MLVGGDAGGSDAVGSNASAEMLHLLAIGQ
jgi:hypothetical protein